MFFSIVYFIICVSACIVVHELGHYLAARFCGIKIREFSLGFGYTLFSYTDKNQVLWKISALPLGGYVKLCNNNTLEELFKFALWKRVLVLICGPLANLTFAALLTSVILMTIGDSKIEKSIFLAKGDSNKLTPVTNIVAHTGYNTITVSTIDNNNLQIELNQDQLNTLLSKLTFMKANENIDLNENNKLIIKFDQSYVRYNPIYAIYLGIKQTILHTISTVKLLFYSLTQKSITNFTGPIGIINYIANDIIKISFVEFVIHLSIGLGVFNLFVPILPLDGGMIVLHCLEKFIPIRHSKTMINLFSSISIVIFVMLVLYINFNDINKILF